MMMGNKETPRGIMEQKGRGWILDPEDETPLSELQGSRNRLRSSG